MSYDGLRRHGVNVVHDTVTAIDAEKKQVRLASAAACRSTAPWSPGHRIHVRAGAGHERAATETIPHAWKAGPQTLLLRAQLRRWPTAAWW